MGDARIPDLNRIQLPGRVSWGPEYKTLSGDNALCKFQLAYSRKFRKKGGGQGEESFFINCEIWGRAAEWARDDLYKGCKILVEGSLKQDTWNKDGVDHTKFGIKVDKIHQLEWKDEGDGGPSAPAEEEVPY